MQRISSVSAMCVLATLVGFASSASGQNLRVYLKSKLETHRFQKTREDSLKKATMGVIGMRKVKEDSVESVYVKLVPDSTLWFGPSVGLDFFLRESQSGAYRAGILPGVGYGLKYKPKSWRSGFLVGLDIFLQGSLSEEVEEHDGLDYFNVDVIPVFTVMNWVGVGFGPRFKVGLNGQESTTRYLFSFGLTKAI